MLKNNLEKRWHEIVSLANKNTYPVLSICGPSGVGKSTLAKALAKNHPTFIETTDGNPHLEALLQGKTDFNASANQDWFLQRVGRYISRANPRSPLILDQDPAAIVFSYSKMFLDDEKMNEDQYVLLLERLLKIEAKLQAWKCARTVLFLDAPADVLRQRVLQRYGKRHTPNIKWFERVRNNFVQLFVCFPNAITISTVEFSPVQIFSRAELLIQRRIKDCQT